MGVAVCGLFTREVSEVHELIQKLSEEGSSLNFVQIVPVSEGTWLELE